MTKDIPEIDDLLKGINDSDMTLTGEPEEKSDSTSKTSQEAPVNEETTDGATAALSPSVEGNKCWQVFMNYLDTSDERGDKDERLVCKLDRDLADSLDDCDIHNRSRSDMVNAIVRAFFETYLPQLS